MADGTVFSLHKRGKEFVLKYNGNELMSTNHTYSEQLLAEKGCAHILEHRKRPSKKSPPPRVLIGGLGLGFTLKRTLELLASPATIEVAELMPPLIEWNRTFLVEHNGPLLEDPRTQIIQGDLFKTLSNKPNGNYDALLLDIDNTPDDLITKGNARLYSPVFLRKLGQLLTTTGKLSYWLSEPAPKFKKLLEQSGFHVEVHPAKQRENSKRAIHCLYICSKKTENHKR